MARGAGRQAFGSNANTQGAGREAETGGGGLLRKSGDVLLTRHPRFTDGTLQCSLSRTALEKAARRLLGVGQLDNDGSKARVVAKHIVEVMLPGHMLCSPGQGNTGFVAIPIECDPEYSSQPMGSMGSAAGATAADFESVEGMPVPKWLHILVDTFHKVCMSAQSQ